MKLQIERGEEYRLIISEDILDKNELMFPAYDQALAALKEIVKKAEEFNASGSECESLSLYGYPSNIIAFSGMRGQGKTSTMVSFSRWLEKKESLEKDLDWLGSCSFTVLPPIDPTVLEENQNILALLLSRMYSFAEQKWSEAMGNQHSICGKELSETEKNSLVRSFQDCLSGINAIKYCKKDEIKSLTRLHDLSDGSRLKGSFYRLTRLLLQICFGRRV